MSGIRIQGNTSGNVAEVNSANELKVNAPIVNNLAGYAAMTSVSDPGVVTGNRYTIDPECSTDYKQRVGLDTLLFNEFFPGAVLNSNLWTAPTTTATITVASGFANLNAGLSVAASAVARLTSYRCFPVYGAVKTYFETTIQFTQLPVTNNVCEWGMGIATALTAPTDGAFFRLMANGEFRCVVVNNSVELQSDTIDFNTLVGNSYTRNFIVAIGVSAVHFWVDDQLVAVISLSVGGGNTISSCSLPIFYRMYNLGIPSVAQVMKIGNVNVTFGDNNYTKNYAHQLSGAGYSSTQTQTGAAAHGQTVLWANSANPVAAAPTNTTAALGVGLGGIFIANINALPPTTDYIIQSYQVPIASSILPGKTLHITGYKVSAVNTVVASGAGPTTWSMALAYGHTTVSLATAESATAKAPRRIPLGIMSLPTASAVGQPADRDIVFSYYTPVIVQPGEFIQTILRFVSNNSAATEAIIFYIAFEGYLE